MLDRIANYHPTDLVTTASTLKALADLCRDPPTRQSLTQQTPLVSMCCQVLCKLQLDNSSQAEEILVLVQLLRCICNSCADNDVGRDQLLSSGGIEQLAKVLVQVDEVRRQPVPVGQAAMGAVLNVCLDHTGCTEAMAQMDGVVDMHLQMLDPSNEQYVIWPLVCSSLDNLCECDQAIKQFEQTPDLALTVLSLLSQFCQILSANKDVDDMKGAQRTLLWVLCETAEKSAVIRKQLCQPALVLSIFDILAFYLTHGPDLIEPEEEEEEEDNEGEPAAMPPNKPIPQNTNRWADAVCQLIVAISGEDTALTSLFDDSQLMSRLVSILQSDNQNEGMAAAALLCLGNLCRTDQHCTQLVQQYPQMIQILVDRWFGERQTDVRTRHAASGVLKNLCLAPANRPTMLELGLNRVAADNLETAVVPIQANSIGILRHLANGQDHQVVSQTIMGLLQGDGDCVLTKLLNVVKGTDIDGIRCEGTRLIATVAKRVYLERDGNAVGNAREILQPEGKFDLVTPLIRLVALDGQRHPLLQQESLVALTVLAATQRFSPDIVRMLAEPVPIPSGEEDGEGPKSQTTFCQVLKSLIQKQQDNASWPQAALQAQSLVKQLSTMGIGDPLLNELIML